MTVLPDNFDPLRGPAALAVGTVGRVRVGGLLAGLLTEWRVVTSPTTGMPTLIGRGTFARYYGQALGGQAEAEVTPSPQPHYIGRKKPPTPRPFRIRGTIAELSATTIIVSHGTLARG